MKPASLWILVLLITGCGLASPNKGETVTQGVARAAFETRLNGTDLVWITVYFPADADGRPVPGPKRPGVVFIQGGFVKTTAYSAQAVMLADAGKRIAVGGPDGRARALAKATVAMCIVILGG